MNSTKSAVSMSTLTKGDGSRGIVIVILLVTAVNYFPAVICDKCGGDDMVRYEMSFEAEWSRETFPRHYPEWRPPAQWSLLIGVSHNNRTYMWRERTPASEAIGLFAENGKNDALLSRITQGKNGILDTFQGPPIPSGVGTTSCRFFADRRHHYMSFMTRMIPSPDWFSGIDTLDLCEKSRWIEERKIDLYPIDAGTDQGLTFTAPDWKNEPQENIRKITAQWPDHPGSSFFRKGTAKLPRIGVLRIRKIRSYAAIKSDETETINNGIMSEQELAVENQVVVNNEIPSFGDAQQNDNAAENATPKRHKRRHEQRQRHKSRGCVVSEWSAWSDCSRVCGIGEKRRTRHVIRKPHPGNPPCPALSEVTWCGSEANCKAARRPYFNW